MRRSADRLYQLCKALRLSPEDFARRLNVPVHRIEEVLQSKRYPTLKLIARVLQAIPDVNPSWLLNGAGAMLIQQTAATIEQQVARNAGVVIGTNHGTSTIHISKGPCDCAMTRQLQAHLDDKERMIQLLLNQQPTPTNCHT